MVGGFLGAGKTTAILRHGGDAGPRRPPRRADHERPERRPRRYHRAVRARLPGRGDHRRLLLLPLQLARRRRRAADRRDAPRRLHRRAGRQLHRPARLGELSAAADVRRRLHRRPAQRRRRPGAGAARPRPRAGPVVQPEGPLRLPEAARGSRAHPDQQGRRCSSRRASHALREALARDYPDGADLRVSARTGQGMDAWIDACSRDEAADRRRSRHRLRRRMARARRSSAGSTHRPAGRRGLRRQRVRARRRRADRERAERRRHRDRAPEDDADAGRRRRRSGRAEPGAQRARAPRCRTRSTASCRAAS